MGSSIFKTIVIKVNSDQGLFLGRQQNPEHGTFRNIPEQGKLSQNK